MHGLRQVIYSAALMVGLTGCATYYPDEYGYPEGDRSNLFHCPSNPYWGFGCPGGFYYNDRFFPDEYAFFTYFHIDRGHWDDFRKRHYWSWDDGIRTGPADSGRQPGGIQGPIGWSGHFPHAWRGFTGGRPLGGGTSIRSSAPHGFFLHD